MIRRLAIPSKEHLPEFKDDEYYLVVSYMPWLDRICENMENYQRTSKFNPSNKIRKELTDKLQSSVGVEEYENAFMDQLKRNNRVDEFKQLVSELEAKYRVVNLICACDNLFYNNYCHVETLLKLVKPVKKEFNWDQEPLDFSQIDNSDIEVIADMEYDFYKTRMQSRNRMRKFRRGD